MNITTNYFMIKVLKKNEGEYGYDKNFIPCFVKVEAQTLYQAVLLVIGKYKDEDKYRIDVDSSYMILDDISLFKHKKEDETKDIFYNEGIVLNTARIINQVDDLINNFYNYEDKIIQLQNVKSHLINLSNQIIEDFYKEEN